MAQNENKNRKSSAEVILMEPSCASDENITPLNLFESMEEKNICRGESNEPFPCSEVVTHSSPHQISDVKSPSFRLVPSNIEVAPSLTVPFARFSLSYACRNSPYVESKSQKFVEINGLPVQLLDKACSRSHSVSSCISSLWVSPKQWIKPISPSEINAYPKVKSSKDYDLIPPLLLLDEGKHTNDLFHKEEATAKDGDNFLDSPLVFSHFSRHCYRYHALLAKVTPKRNARKNSKVYPLPLLDYSKCVLTDHYKHLQKLLQAQQHLQKQKEAFRIILYHEKEENMHNGEEANRIIDEFELESDDSKEVYRKADMIEKESASLLSTMEETHKKVRRVLQEVRDKRKDTYARRGKLLRRRFSSKKFYFTSFSDLSSAHLPLSNSRAPSLSEWTSPASSSPKERQRTDDFFLPEEQPHDRGGVLLLPLSTQGHPCYDGVQLEPGHRYQIVKFVGEHLCPAARKGWKLVFPDFHIVHSGDTTAASAYLPSTSRTTQSLPTASSTLTKSPSCLRTLHGNKESFEVNSFRPSSPFPSDLPLHSYGQEHEKTSSSGGWSNSKAGKVLAAALFQRENPGKVLDEAEEPSSSENEEEERNPEGLGEEKGKSERILSSCATLTHPTPHSPSYTRSGQPSPSPASQTEYSLYSNTAYDTAECTSVQVERTERATVCSEHPPSLQLSHTQHAPQSPASPIKRKKKLRQIYAERCWQALFGNYSQT